MKKKILFLGETYRADAITWMNGLTEFGDFELFTWELSQGGTGINKIKRAIEMLSRLKELQREILKIKPDLIIAERVTSYGFIAALFYKYAPVIIAQQGITDIFPPDGMKEYGLNQPSIQNAHAPFVFLLRSVMQALQVLSGFFYQHHNQIPLKQRSCFLCFWHRHKSH